jgi:hypothetical protein
MDSRDKRENDEHEGNMTDDSLLREVNDAVRHDQMVALWRQYRMPLLCAAIALIVATAGSSAWHSYKEKQGSIAMGELDKAQTLYGRGQFKEAATAFAAMADHAMDRNLKDMGHLWQARALQSSGDKEGAVKILLDVANRPAGSDAIWPDLACLRLAGLDESKANCLGNGKSPLKAERDIARAAQLWHEGKSKEAAKLLQTLADDPNTAENVRARAQHYLTVVGQADAAE